MRDPIVVYTREEPERIQLYRRVYEREQRAQAALDRRRRAFPAGRLPPRSELPKQPVDLEAELQ